MEESEVIEARSRLLSVLSVRDHEGDALRDLDDGTLSAALEAIEHAKAELADAVASLGIPPHNGSR